MRINPLGTVARAVDTRPPLTCLATAAGRRPAAPGWQAAHGAWGLWIQAGMCYSPGAVLSRTGLWALGALLDTPGLQPPHTSAPGTSWRASVLPQPQSTSHQAHPSGSWLLRQEARTTQISQQWCVGRLSCPEQVHLGAIPRNQRVKAATTARPERRCLPAQGSSPLP